MISLKTFAKILIVVLLLTGVHWKFYRYYDPEAGCNIKIKMSFLEWSNSNIKKALSILKYGAPEDYANVCSHIEVINPTMSCGGWQGGCYYNNPGEIFISTSKNEFLAWTAAIIVHETCHDIQAKEGRPPSEEECYSQDHDVLQKLVQY